MRAVAAAFTALLWSSPLVAAEATLGPLTLAYDEAAWAVELRTAGATIRCLTDACAAGSAIDVAVVEDEGVSCDRDAMYAASAGSFPQTRRQAVNAHAVANFMLYFGIAGDDPALDADAAVRACVGHDGASVHITSQEDDGLPAAGHAAAVFELLRDGLRGAPGEAREIRIGDLVIPYPTDRWRAHQSSPERWTMACLPPACVPEALVTVTQLPEGEGCPDHEGGLAHDQEAQTVVGGNALQFTLVTTHLGCRNWVPPHYSACAAHAGRAYVVASLGDGGCRWGPGVSEAAMRSLIAAAAPAS